MRKYIYIIFIALTFSSTGCKKFLNIVPTDNLSGNNFWQTKKDVEGFTNGLYASLKNKLSGGFITLADMRSSPIATTEGTYGNLLATNSLRTLQTIAATPTQWNGSAYVSQWTVGWNWSNMTRWKPFYDIISSANLLYERLDDVPTGVLSNEELKRYKAEAVFVRNLCYLFLVRLYGDVPYYTNALNTSPLGRTPMLEVLNKCIADVNAVKADLPWVYIDPSLIGVRAMRGGAIALLMHLNMWAAGFDSENNKVRYYNQVKDLGIEIDNAKDYSLLPYTVEDNKRIFKGKTRESLFELYQSFNNGEKFSVYSNVGYVLSHYPYLGALTFTTSRGYYQKTWMDKLYNDALPDARKDLWFENRTANNNTFQFKKFANVYVSGTTVQNDDDLIIFRLSDAYLLAAEANAEIGDDVEAKRFLNKVRQRAVATDIVSTGVELKKDIYLERVRELMGEGHYYYDLVRTKKLCDPDFCPYPVSVAAFNAGAWTWPIDQSALTENPNMTLNNYWR
ncbi:MAG: RagB/SusD family nutrient uptake outer membrane protein [Pedobacter sp.]|uniref:RagB/SusD family nutrient uptake outer membrane protein n=1 Tax=Pedobacter sp. TaxID=1411316 RepID=UPI002808F989|nr:RagB/SusD family nutrient uptake outer membrane protein [Pedobacter sp.]MDQ8006692.1 RagB/SusD family nutrient uptake outer membrane protein [Pedobacter sp.]